MKKKHIPQDLDLVAKHIQFEFRHWHEIGYISTLGDLLRKMRVVEYDMARFDSDALIADHWEYLRVGLDYIELFGDPNKHEYDLPGPFEYRLANVEEDITHIEELIEGLGESFKFSDLPKSVKKNPNAA